MDSDNVKNVAGGVLCISVLVGIIGWDFWLGPKLITEQETKEYNEKHALIDFKDSVESENAYQARFRLDKKEDSLEWEQQFQIRLEEKIKEFEKNKHDTVSPELFLNKSRTYRLPGLKP